MSQLTETTTAAGLVGAPLRHVYCVAHGAPSMGLCGSPRNIDAALIRPLTTSLLTGHPVCVVCADLAPAPCPECGT